MLLTSLILMACLVSNFFLSFLNLSILLSYITSTLKFNLPLLLPGFPLPPFSTSSNPPPFPFRERTGLPEISTKYGLTSYNKPKHILSYQDWTRQTSRRGKVPSAGKRVRNTRHSHCYKSHKNTKLHSHKIHRT